MGRHKKNKLKFSSYYEVKDQDGDMIDLIATDKRTQNAIKEIHRQNYKSASSFMDLKFYLERELHYLKKNLDNILNPEVYKYIYMQKQQRDALFELCNSVKVMTETIKHFPERIWIKIDDLPNTKLNKTILSEWIFDVVNERLKPLNEDDIIKLQEQYPNYVEKTYRPLHRYLYVEEMRRRIRADNKRLDAEEKEKRDRERRL